MPFSTLFHTYDAYCSGDGDPVGIGGPGFPLSEGQHGTGRFLQLLGQKMQQPAGDESLNHDGHDWLVRFYGEAHGRDEDRVDGWKFPGQNQGHHVVQHQIE